MSGSIPQLQACRTCEHGRDIRRVSGALGICDLQHETLYRIPEHEHDDQGGYHRECADWQCRAEVVDAEMTLDQWDRDNIDDEINRKEEQK